MEQKEHQHYEMHAGCAKLFDAMKNRMDNYENKVTEHTTQIAVLQTNLDNLIKSMSGLTKAIWGACATTITTLVAFVLWYIQHI